MIVQSYATIEAAANRVLIRVGAVLEAVLLVLFLAFVPLLARVTRRIRVQIDQIQHHAWHDELTGLPNRRQFGARLEGVGSEPAAVLTFDLDRFKEINETLGHESGDQLLRELGRRVSRVLDPGSVLARLGGDEFGILLTGAGRSDASATARLVLDELREPYEVKGVPVGIEASVGVALRPEHGDDAESLLRRANVAMYVAKDHRLGFAFYEPHLDATDTTRLSLLSELRRALAEHEIVPYYQLKGHMRGGSVAGAETLLRWQHSERGLVSAGEFVPFAERTGLNRELTQYVLRAAAEQIRTWSARGLGIKVAVNLTMFDVFDPELPGQVAALIEESGIAPSQLELEITESAAMRDVARVRTVLEELRRMGVTLAIDDFGTGYSSLAYLKTLPVDSLKLDKSLIDGVVEDPKDRAIVQAAIDVAHGLGLEVVAEGIETAEVWDCLAGLGCDVGQGYFFARPSPAHEVTARLLELGHRDEKAHTRLRAVVCA